VKCIVADTNLLISRLLLPNSVPAKALERAIKEGNLIFSIETLEELARVLEQPKFDPYLELEERLIFFQLLGRISQTIPVTRDINACRDPSDDKFLSVAVNGQADCLITGDKDLLVLHPFMGIPVLSPRDYLVRGDCL